MLIDVSIPSEVDKFKELCKELDLDYMEMDYEEVREAQSIDLDNYIDKDDVEMEDISDLLYWYSDRDKLEIVEADEQEIIDYLVFNKKLTQKKIIEMIRKSNK